MGISAYLQQLANDEVDWRTCAVHLRTLRKILKLIACPLWLFIRLYGGANAVDGC